MVELLNSRTNKTYSEVDSVDVEGMRMEDGRTDGRTDGRGFRPNAFRVE